MWIEEARSIESLNLSQTEDKFTWCAPVYSLTRGDKTPVLFFFNVSEYTQIHQHRCTNIDSVLNCSVLCYSPQSNSHQEMTSSTDLVQWVFWGWLPSHPSTPNYQLYNPWCCMSYWQSSADFSTRHRSKVRNLLLFCRTNKQQENGFRCSLCYQKLTKMLIWHKKHKNGVSVESQNQNSNILPPLGCQNTTLSSTLFVYLNQVKSCKLNTNQIEYLTVDWIAYRINNVKGTSYLQLVTDQLTYWVTK